jgi:endonuclease YncB( thermonuclease family)
VSNRRNIIEFPKRSVSGRKLFGLISLASILVFFLTLAGAFVWDGIAQDGIATSGTAHVIDGDTIDIGDRRIRIHGIDAPEVRQTCVRDEVTWLCGQEAGQRLRTLVRGSKVTCEGIDQDRYGRIVAKCFAGGRDVGEVMVSEGLALAYRQYSIDYVEAEAAAKATRRGIWSGQFVEPWDWRRGRRLTAAPANDNAACEIKGNISRSGERIYHVPGGAYYGRTKIDQSKGERMFCSETEARAAGWRRSKR